MAMNTPDLGLLVDVVADKVLKAMRVASAQLTRIGVRHELVGGLAVGAHGHPRATKNVDFLVGEEAFEHHAGGLVTMKSGMPIQVDGIIVDFLSAQAMRVSLSEPAALGPGSTVTVPVAPLTTIIQLKLLSPRAKDAADIVELIKAGAKIAPVRAYLAAQASELLVKWDEIAGRAAAEEETL